MRMFVSKTEELKSVWKEREDRMRSTAQMNSVLLPMMRRVSRASIRVRE